MVPRDTASERYTLPGSAKRWGDHTGSLEHSVSGPSFVMADTAENPTLTDLGKIGESSKICCVWVTVDTHLSLLSGTGDFNEVTDVPDSSDRCVSTVT